MNILGGSKKKAEIEKRLAQLDVNKLPRHVAIIMDGNGRWAKNRKLPRAAGHRIGINSVHDIVDFISDDLPQIEALTLYAFSTENWFRPADEVSTLMKLLIEFLRKELALMERKKIRFQTIGRIEGLPVAVQEEIEKTKQRTKDNKGLILNIALNYSSHVEIVDAVRNVVTDVQSGKLNPADINEKSFDSYLYTANLPELDLLIRTSGEMRISNFLLWQLAYAELWITPTLWPDFRELEFLEGLLAYQQRERRFGRIGA